MFCPQCGTNNPEGTHFCSNLRNGARCSTAACRCRTPGAGPARSPWHRWADRVGPSAGYSGAPDRTHLARNRARASEVR